MTIDTGRPTDDVLVGGGKNENLPKITPFVAKHLNTASTEGMRLDLEDQLREISDVTKSILTSIRKLEEKVTTIDERTRT